MAERERTERQTSLLDYQTSSCSTPTGPQIFTLLVCISFPPARAERNGSRDRARAATTLAAGTLVRYVTEQLVFLEGE